MKKVLCMMLSVLLVVTMFTGCKKDTPNTGGEVSKSNERDTQDGKDGNKGEGQAKDKTEDSNFNPTGLPIVDEKITLKMMGSQHPAQGDWSKMEVMQYLEEKTNIHMDITTIPDEGYTEKKNLAFASGDLPDLFFRAKFTIQDEELYGTAQGLLMPMNELIEEYAPNLNKRLEEKPDANKAITALDDNIYALPYIYSTSTMADVRWINTKWLEDIDMDMPETVDDLYEILKAFKEQDPNKNGERDEIPMSMTSLDQVSHYLLPAFGIIGDRWSIKDDKTIYTPLEDEYKEYILYMKKLYSEGLLDQEIFSHTLDQVQAKIKSNRVGVFHDTLATVEDDKERGNHYVLPPLTSHVNNEKMTSDIPGVVTGTFAITHENKYPEATIRWVDLFYADHPDEAIEGISGLTVDKGWEGIYWEYTNEEKTEERSLPKPENWSKHEDYTPFGAGGVPRYISSWTKKKADDEVPNPTAIKQDGSEENYFPYMKHAGYPSHVRFTDEEAQRLTVIDADLETYVDQMEAKFIVGEEPIEKWDEFINRIKNIGIDEALNIRQMALDRWNSVE